MQRGTTAGPDGTPVRVALQHGRQLFRDGLARLLPIDAALEVVGSVATPKQLRNLCKQARPAADVALVDGEADPATLAAATRFLRGDHPGLALVALTMGHGARRSPPGPGFDAAVDRGAPLATIVRTIVRAAGRHPADAVRGPAPGHVLLTEREREVLSLLGQGLTGRAIAECLAITAKTVDYHKSHIFDKLQTRNQAHAVSVALRRGLLPLDRV